MESMKGHQKPRRTIQNELTTCNTTPFLTDFVSLVIALGGTNLKPQTQSQGSQITPDLGSIG